MQEKFFHIDILDIGNGTQEKGEAWRGGTRGGMRTYAAATSSRLSWQRKLAASGYVLSP